MEIKKIEFKKQEAIIRETYVDSDGHEKERVKMIMVPYFGVVKKALRKDYVNLIFSYNDNYNNTDLLLNLTENYFTNKKASDEKKFILNQRQNFLLSEFDSFIKEKKIRDALVNMLQFIEEQSFLNTSDKMNGCKECKYITEIEKKHLLYMADQIRKILI